MRCGAAHRVEPRTVIELVKPSLLVYICKNSIEEDERHDDPALVSAMAVHEWVMKVPEKPFGADSEEGLKRLKAVKIDLGGVRPHHM